MLIILDRDGVINYDSDAYIKSPEEWQPMPGSLEAIARLNKAGHLVTVATNQSGIGRGYYSEAVLQQIHQKMTQQLAKFGGHIDGLFYCPHIPEDHCECRKPKPGLLLQIAAAFKTDLTQALLIGDSLRDIEAAQAASCPSILVQTGKNEAQALAMNDQLKNTMVFADLNEAVKAILKNLYVLAKPTHPQ
jgi:D-glycero-D-manno-heptose 1,7-bisphosphate phosphatase